MWGLVHIYVEQMTINHHQVEMSDLHVKLIHEQQKSTHYNTLLETQYNATNDVQKELKVGSHFVLYLQGGPKMAPLLFTP